MVGGRRNEFTLSLSSFRGVSPSKYTITEGASGWKGLVEDGLVNGNESDGSIQSFGGSYQDSNIRCGDRS